LLPEGFSASGVNCGVRRYRPDVGLIVSDRDAVAAGVFTLNQVQAAPVAYCRRLLPSARIRALLTNSGQANAVTGAAGVEDNFRLVRSTAAAVGVEPEQVLIASTGVIGVRVDVDKVAAVLPELELRLTDTAEAFALAVMTTDLVPKTVTTTVALRDGAVRITGIAKGSGMIHPNMATMLGYLLTDAALPQDDAGGMLRRAVDVSFNMISVDGDTSTNDSVFLLANGASGVAPADAADLARFEAALTAVATALAQSIARDGEGATKLVEVNVTGAPDGAWARRAARAVTLSPLVKSAMNGEDPNWGRILARLGAEQIPADCLSRLTLSLQGQPLLSAGEPLPFSKDRLRSLLRRDKVVVDIALDSGPAAATAWGCDLSKKYVEINAEYTT
jgi:glutamate N-acetyltransferase/amino-acid N-acetyltransferase